MSLSDVESQVILQRLARPKFFDQVFPRPYASSDSISIVYLGQTGGTAQAPRHYFGVLIRSGSVPSTNSRRTRHRRYDIRNQIESMIRAVDINIHYNNMHYMILNHIQRDGFNREKHQPMIDAALAANPAAVKTCMRGGKFRRSTSILSKKEQDKKYVADLSKEVSQLRKLLVVDSWNLRHICNDAGKYVANAVATELKAKFGNKLEDIELKFAYPSTTGTSGQAMLSCLEFFSEAFGGVDQTALFTFLARSQDYDYRRWCALAAPKSFLLPLLIDADPSVRESAKINKEDKVISLLNRLHDLEIELKKFEELR